MTKFRHAWLVLTYACNNKCIWCYNEPQNKNLKYEKMLSLKKAKSYIDFIKKLKINSLTLIGGEPTCWPHLLSLTRYCRDKKIRTILVTNGRKLADLKFVDKLIESKVNDISFSIEGPNAQTHDKITTVKGSFEETMKGVRNCINRECDVTTVVTISSENKNQIKDIVDMCIKNGIERIIFNFCTPTINDVHSSTISFKEVRRILPDIVDYCEKQKISIKFATALPLCIIQRNKLKKLLERNIVGGSCHVFSGNCLVIDYKGNVLPCTHWIDVPITNITQKELRNPLIFSKKWNNDVRREREKIWRYPSKNCVDCKYWGKCVGGCPIFWLKFDPSVELKGFKK